MASAFVMTTKPPIFDKNGSNVDVVEPQSITSLLPGLTRDAAHSPSGDSETDEGNGKVSDVDVAGIAGTAPPNWRIMRPCASSAARSFLIVTSDVEKRDASASTWVCPLSLIHETMAWRLSSTDLLLFKYLAPQVNTI